MQQSHVKPDTDGLIKLSGTISDYTCSRSEANFVFTDSTHSAIDIVAVAVSATKKNHQPIAMDPTVSMVASKASTMEEEADYVQFSIDGQPVKGWVWRSPFGDGDEVEVAAQWQDDHYEAFGIARPADRIIALYPHCARGRAWHIRNVFKWWLGVGVFGVFFLISLIVIYVIGFSAFSKPNLYVTCSVFSLLSAGAFLALGRKWMPFVRVSEKVFKALGWPDAENIDLIRSTKAQRTKKDAAGVGTYYFKY